MKGEAELRVKVDAEQALAMMGKINGQVQIIEKTTQRSSKAQSKFNSIIGQGKAQWAMYTVGIHSAIGVAQQLFGALKAGFDAAMKAAKSMAIEDAFNKAFPGAAALTDKLREASGFQIDTTSLQKLAREGKTAGLTADQLAEALGLAVRAANALGEDAAESASKVINSYTKMTGEGLESLKVRIKMGEVMADHRARVGLLGDKMTKNQETEAMHLAIVRELGKAYGDIDIKDTPYAEMSKIQADYENMADSVGRAWMDVVVWAGTGSDRLYNTMSMNAERYMGWMGVFDDRFKHMFQQVNDMEGLHARDEANMERRAYLVKWGTKQQVAAYDQRQKEIAQRKILGDAYDLMNAQEREHFIQLGKEVDVMNEAITAHYKKATATAAASKELSRQARIVGDLALASKESLTVYANMVKQAKQSDPGGLATGWDKARGALMEATGSLEIWNRRRLEWLVSLAASGPLLKKEADELANLKKWFAENSRSVDYFFDIQNPEEKLRGFSEATKQAVEQQQRSAFAASNNAAESARAAFALGNYALAAKHATDAASKGETAGEGYRAKIVQQRNALIDATKAQIQHTRALIADYMAQIQFDPEMASSEAFGNILQSAQDKLFELREMEKKILGKADEKEKKTKPRGKATDRSKEQQREQDELHKRFVEQIKQRRDAEFNFMTNRIQWTRDRMEVRKTELQFEQKVGDLASTWAEKNLRQTVSIKDELQQLADLREDAAAYWEKEIRAAESRGDVVALAEGLTRHQEVIDELGNAMQEKREELNQHIIELNQSMIDASVQSIQSGLAMAAEAGSAFSGQLLEAIGHFEAGWARATTVYEGMIKAGATQNEAIKASAPAAISSSGKILSSFTDDQGKKATLLALMEGASAIAAFASGMWHVGAMHTLAAAAYANAAAHAGKSAKKPARVSRAAAPKLGAGDRGGQRTVHLHFAGSTIIGNDKEAGAQLAGMIGEHSEWTGDEPAHEAA